ncbi:MauE/DoxX family redox-associated membrane protein [Nocardia sp. NPDC023852]|uniref:peroxiredoxin family protein n=1 Tax=Nocardia sp. NPDC023852 TaxID=3154697 RepID=UPI0033FA1B03
MSAPVWDGAGMLIDYGVWLSRLVVAVVFGLSAWGKLTDRSGTRTALGEFGLPIWWVPVMAWGLPAVEMVVAVAVLPPWTAVAAAVLALALLVVFTLAMIRLLRQGKRPACSCFGASNSAPIGVRSIVRNGVIALIAVFVGWGGLAHPQVPADLPADHAVALSVVMVLSAALGWLAGQLGVLRRRLDEQALSTLGAEGLPVGAVAPEFELPDIAGGRTSLEALLDSGRQLLMVFVHPGCELCAALARELPRWHARTAEVLSIVMVGNGDVVEHAAWGREQGLVDIPVLVQQGNEAALRYRVRGTPSAVLIDAEGKVAAPVARGAMAVRDLLMVAKTAGRHRNGRRNGSPVLDRR